MNLSKLILPVVILFFVSANSAEIKGQGFIKTDNGRVITCAGEKVYLDVNNTSAVGKYSWALATLNLSKAMENNFNVSGKYKMAREEAKEIQKYKKLVESWKDTLNKNVREGNILVTKCDAQGNFEFKNVPKGYYPIGTTVEWKVGYKTEGGFISKLVDVKSKEESIKVLITE